MNNPIKLIDALYAVEVPADAKDFRVTYNHNYQEDMNLSSWDITFLFNKTLRLRNYVSLNIQDENIRFEILGEVTADEISFDPIKFVNAYGNDKHLDLYGYEETTLKNRVEQFYSLLQSKGLYFVNPMGEKSKWVSPNGVKWEDYEKQWKEAESKVIKGKLVIIKLIL